MGKHQVHSHSDRLKARAADHCRCQIDSSIMYSIHQYMKRAWCESFIAIETGYLYNDTIQPRLNDRHRCDRLGNLGSLLHLVGVMPTGTYMYQVGKVYIISQPYCALLPHRQYQASSIFYGNPAFYSHPIAAIHVLQTKSNPQPRAHTHTHTHTHNATNSTLASQPINNESYMKQSFSRVERERGGAGNVNGKSLGRVLDFSPTLDIMTMAR